uniref:Endosulphine n=1 Tax=Daucus carota subsp. sativus TaxID=79200 RepID=A0A169WSZ1_DAUCS
MATACNRNGDNNSIAAQDHEDHERAFFDSADWALCKQGAGETPKTTGAIETLQPKMQAE